MKLQVYVFAALLLLVIINFGNACSPSMRASDAAGGAELAASCPSDESTYAPLDSRPNRVGYLGSNKVAYALRDDGLIVVDGDMLFWNEGAPLPSQKPKFAASQGIGVGPLSIWPSGVVPYVIDSNVPDQQRVMDAIEHWNDLLDGVIQFIPRTNQTDYARVSAADSGCAAFVGFQSGMGAHPVLISNQCGSGNIAHEFGHILGLDHEQNRLDRDSFVRIAWENITAGLENNFAIRNPGRNLMSYDFGSIMHYSLNAFSKNGSQTIIPKVSMPSGVVVGQRSSLSLGDINSVRQLYGASPITGTSASSTTPANTQSSSTACDSSLSSSLAK